MGGASVVEKRARGGLQTLALPPGYAAILFAGPGTPTTAAREQRCGVGLRLAYWVAQLVTPTPGITVGLPRTAGGAGEVIKPSTLRCSFRSLDTPESH